jgi:hypothetical protein
MTQSFHFPQSKEGFFIVVRSSLLFCGHHSFDRSCQFVMASNQLLEVLRHRHFISGMNHRVGQPSAINGGMIEFDEVSREAIYVPIRHIIGVTWAHSSVQEFVRHSPV